MKIGNILIWDAYGSSKRPICLSDECDFGLDIEVYYGKKGIRGVAAFDQEGNLIGSIGRIPKRVKEES